MARQYCKDRQKYDRAVERLRQERKMKTQSSVTVECIGCGKKRDIGPGEVAANDMPMCEYCMMPMIAVKATVKAK